eukprot:gene17386-23689_t
MEENRLRLLVTERIAALKEKEAAEMKLRLEQMLIMEVEAPACLTTSNATHYRDRVNFESIADEMGTRAPVQCRKKW